ncbi:basic blue protein, partial [Trifolium pratense]
VFKYTPVIHNVVVVDESHYNKCSGLGGLKYYFSGSTNITLAKGANYFLCGTPGHCGFGMKIAVNAN